MCTVRTRLAWLIDPCPFRTEAAKHTIIPHSSPGASPCRLPSLYTLYSTTTTKFSSFRHFTRCHQPATCYAAPFPLSRLACPIFLIFSIPCDDERNPAHSLPRTVIRIRPSPYLRSARSSASSITLCNTLCIFCLRPLHHLLFAHRCLAYSFLLSDTGAHLGLCFSRLAVPLSFFFLASSFAVANQTAAHDAHTSAHGSITNKSTRPYLQKRAYIHDKSRRAPLPLSFRHSHDTPTTLQPLAYLGHDARGQVRNPRPLPTSRHVSSLPWWCCLTLDSCPHEHLTNSALACESLRKFNPLTGFPLQIRRPGPGHGI